MPLENRVQAGLCLVPERRELFADMPVEDNLLLGGFRRPRAERKQTLEEIYARLPRLKERRRQLAGTLSGGERQMLAMGRALMARPTLLMLDEPSLGLAPRIVRDVFHILTDLRKSRRLDSAGRAECARGAGGRRLCLCDGTRRDHHAGLAGRKLPAIRGWSKVISASAETSIEVTTNEREKVMLRNRVG